MKREPTAWMKDDLRSRQFVTGTIGDGMSNPADCLVVIDPMGDADLLAKMARLAKTTGLSQEVLCLCIVK